jgi:hypothetical protein
MAARGERASIVELLALRFFCLSLQHVESIGELSRGDAVTTIEELGFRSRLMPHFEMGDILGNEWTGLQAVRVDLNP